MMGVLMAANDTQTPRSQLLEVLMEKVDEDTYPSSTMLDLIESLLGPRETQAYAEALLERIRNDRFPSLSMIRRVQRYC